MKGLVLAVMIFCCCISMAAYATETRQIEINKGEQVQLAAVHGGGRLLTIERKEVVESFWGGPTKRIGFWYIVYGEKKIAVYVVSLFFALLFMIFFNVIVWKLGKGDFLAFVAVFFTGIGAATATTDAATFTAFIAAAAAFFAVDFLFFSQKNYYMLSNILFYIFVAIAMNI